MDENIAHEIKKIVTVKLQAKCNVLKDKLKT